MVTLQPVGGVIPSRDESRVGVLKKQELVRQMTRSAALGTQGEDKMGKNSALRETSADGLGIRDFLNQLFSRHCLIPDTKLAVCLRPYSYL